MECSRSHHNNWAKDRKNYPGEAGHPGIYYLPSKYNMHHSLFPLKLNIMYTNLHHCTCILCFFHVIAVLFFLMVSALDSGASAPGSSPGQGHCVVFLGKTPYSHSASLHPGVQMGTSELLGKT